MPVLIVGVIGIVSGILTVCWWLSWPSGKREDMPIMSFLVFFGFGIGSLYTAYHILLPQAVVWYLNAF
jgi:hypothetical protein